MKKVLTKLGFMAFGCLLTLIGYHFGNVDNNSADAQVVVKTVPRIVDEVRCRKLVIVGEDDTPRITLGTDFLDRGSIQIYNEDGVRRVLLGHITNFDGGVLEIAGKDLKGLAAMLGADDNGGFMALFNKTFDEPVVETVISQNGQGYIFIKNNVGVQSGVMGPLGGFTTQRKKRN